jgi:hypothetical protein
LRKVRAVNLTTLLDVFGVAALAAFAFFVWPPAALLVVGAALLFASWRAS